MGLGTKMLRRCPCRAAVDATDTIAATLATVSNCSTAFGYDTKTVFLCPSEVSPGLRLLPYLFAPDSQMLDGQLHRIHTFSVLAFALASVVLALTSSSFTSSSFFSQVARRVSLTVASSKFSSVLPNLLRTIALISAETALSYGNCSTSAPSRGVNSDRSASSCSRESSWAALSPASC